MKLGFVTAIVPELSFKQVLKLARDEDFGCVEVMCWPVGRADRKYAGVTHLDVTNFTKTLADDVNALCAEHGVAMSALGYYPNALDPMPETRHKAPTAVPSSALTKDELPTAVPLLTTDVSEKPDEKSTTPTVERSPTATLPNPDTKV